jgi:DNA-binding CsgD family transcriptional regulator
MASMGKYAPSAPRSEGEGTDPRLTTQKFRRIELPWLDTVEALAEQRDALRDLATAADRVSTEAQSLALVWRELTRGSCKVVDCFFSVDRCFLLTRTVTAPPVPLIPQRRRILEAVLVEGAQKVVAIDLGVAASTIASNAQHALELLGVHGKPSRPHPLLVLAAKAARCGDGTAAGSLSFVTQAEVRIRVVSVPRPERALAKELSCAEFAVVRSFIEGDCYATIARRRGTSERTVANQIASVFRRLRVSGRAELLSRLFASQ